MHFTYGVRFDLSPVIVHYTCLSVEKGIVIAWYMHGREDKQLDYRARKTSTHESDLFNMREPCIIGIKAYDSIFI